MKKNIFPGIICCFCLNAGVLAAADVLMPIDHIKREIEHTRQTLSLLEGYLAEKQDDKKEIVIDYRHRGICDVDEESILTLSYKRVLDELSQESDERREGRPISVFLAENYLEDDTLEKIVSFILEKSYLRDNLVELDVSNNRFSKLGLPILRCLVDQCPKLNKLNIAINYISYPEFIAVFGDLSVPKKEKIKFSVY